MNMKARLREHSITSPLCDPLDAIRIVRANVRTGRSAHIEARSARAQCALMLYRFARAMRIDGVSGIRCKAFAKGTLRRHRDGAAI
jgi:hypothetical protein